MNRTLYGCAALAAVMVAGLFAGPEALAQRGPRHHEPGERLDQHLQMMDERLDLTDEQESQIRALLEEHAAEMRSWREDNDSSTRDERRAHMRESMTTLREKVHAVLTDEQTENLKAMHERMQDRRRHRHDHRKADMFEELNLSDAQKEQLRDLRESQRTEIKEWREANPDASREDWRERMRSQAEEHRAALMEILTDKQRQQLEERRAEWEARRGEWKERRDEQGGERRHRQKQRDEQADNGQADNSAEQGAATRFQLENYPNPFNPSTEIRFELPVSGPVELSVYDAQGREVESLLNETLSAGSHSVTFEAGDLPSGVYLYRLSYGGQVATGRMTLSK